MRCLVRGLFLQYFNSTAPWPPINKQRHTDGILPSHRMHHRKSLADVKGELFLLLCQHLLAARSFDKKIQFYDMVDPCERGGAPWKNTDGPSSPRHC